MLSADQLVAALEFQKQHGGRLGEILIENGYVPEQALLRFLAAEYRTRYVSTEKLSKVKIPSAILDRVPVRMAEQAAVLPILWDEPSGTLSVVMAEPQNLQLIEEIRLLSESGSVAAYIASRSAVRAAVKKHYYGDISAFADLESVNPRAREDVRVLVDYYEHARGSGSGVSELKVPTETNPGTPHSGTAAAPTSVRQAIDEVHGASLTSDNDFIETLNVLVGLLEIGRGPLKGHSAAVAKLVRSLSRRMGLNERETNHHIIAAYLHDLGKKPDRHLTAIKVAEDEGHHGDAEKYYRTPHKLMESVHLPVEVNRILGQLYEAWDGSGVPEGLRGADISLGARLIAAVDAYEDLTHLGRDGADPLDRDLAIAELTAYAGTLLDPQVVELLRQIVTGDLMRQKLLADGQHIVILDPDPENGSLLELKLTQKGYVTSVARSAAAALDILSDGADLLITETLLGEGETGLTFVSHLRSLPWGEGLPVVFLTTDARPESVEQGLSLGAADYVVKQPDAVEVFLAKVKRVLDTHAAAGAKGKSIRGTLDEMPLPDILTILSEAGRSGQVVVTGHRRNGEIFLEKGRVVSATFGEVRGEEAFTGVLSIRSGEFVFNPDVEVLDRTLDVDVEQLIGRARQRLARG